MAVQREVDRWRAKAEENLAQANKLLSALLWAAKELVGLSTMHQPDDFSHCPVCKVPWPCPTAERIRLMSQVFEKAQPDNGEAEEKEN